MFGYAWRSMNRRRSCAAHPTSRSRAWWRSPPKTWSLTSTRSGGSSCWQTGVLQDLSPTFSRMYTKEGRPSVPPEHLLLPGATVPVTTDCDAEGAICTEGGRTAGNRAVIYARVSGQSQDTGGEDLNLRAYSLHRTPTPAQQARWEAVRQAKGQGLSLRSIARKLGMTRVAARKYAIAESPPTKKLSAKERAKAESLAKSLVAAD